MKMRFGGATPSAVERNSIDHNESYSNPASRRMYGANAGGPPGLNQSMVSENNRYSIYLDEEDIADVQAADNS